MVKLVYCMHRRPELSHEAFIERWHVQHAPMLEARREVLKVRGYEQWHTDPSVFAQQIAAARGGPTPFDGLAVVTYDSLDALQSTLADRAARQAGREMIEDERQFIDFARSPVFITNVHEIIK